MNGAPMRVQVIVYAHSHVSEAQACLESALRSFSAREFIIVDEADNQPATVSWLREFTARHGSVLMENFDRLGYWKSVMKAIDRSCADYLVILDTVAVVSRNGLRELVECLHADDTIEVALPLTNYPLKVNGNVDLLATALENSPASGDASRSIGPFDGWSAFAIRRSSTQKLASWRYADDALSGLSEPLDVSVAPGCYALDPNRPSAAMSSSQPAPIADTIARLARKTALFVLADGAQSVLLQVQGLRDCGMFAEAVIGSSGSRWLTENFPGALDFCAVRDDDDELLARAAGFDFVVATDFRTARILDRVCEADPSKIPLYYLRDYEPWSAAGASAQQEAERTLTDCARTAGFFARNEWVCRTMWLRHRMEVTPIAWGLDRSLYNGFLSRHDERSGPIVIACAIQPASPSGNARNALRMIRKVAVKHGRKVDVRVFGCTDEELDQIDEARGFRFRNMALLKRPELAQLLYGADIFADLSVRQSEESSGLEAMAVGCAAILPREGCAREIALDGENCIVVDTSDEREVLTAFDRLIGDRQLLTQLRTEGMETGRRHSIRKTVWSELLVFAESVGNKAQHASQ